MPASHGLAARVRGRAVVADVSTLIAAGLGLELQPVHRGCAADEHQLVLVRDRTECRRRSRSRRSCTARICLALSGAKLVKLLIVQVGHQLERIRALDRELRHVVRLVEQHARSRARRAARRASW